MVAQIVLPHHAGRRPTDGAGKRPELRVCFRGKPRVSPWARSLGKRLFDVSSALLALLFALPVMLVIGVAIWIEDGWPIFYTQKRGGRDGRPFRFLKFRSMIRSAEAKKDALRELNESDDGVIFKLHADPRVTRIGSLLRRTSLDELPQLFHVLSGKMSLVGPRPHPVAEVADYAEDDRFRLATKPGVTCLWQVMGRSDLPFGQQLILDWLYLEHQSLLVDLKILLKTFPAVLSGRGAY